MQGIDEILDKIADEHPYKTSGNRGSFSQYNEGWQDAIDRVRGVLKLFFEEGEYDGWIPVEFLLPEAEKYYKSITITDKQGLVHWDVCYGTPEVTDKDPCFYSWDEDHDFFFIYDAIAWRPPSKPYKPAAKTNIPDWRKAMLSKFDRREGKGKTIRV